MNKAEIEARGYKWFSPPPSKPYISNCWQKRIRDENSSTLYFITIYEYSFTVHEELNIGYETEVQLYQKNTRNALNFQYLDGWSLEDIEQNVSDLYRAGNFVPYDEG